MSKMDIFRDIKDESNKNSSFVFIILVLLSIPLSYFANSVCLGMLVVITAFYCKKQNLFLDKYLLLPIALYLLMLLSTFWSIDEKLTIPALSKELSLLIIPLCFLFFGVLSNDQKQKIIKYYSYGIFMFSVFYLIKATVRYFLTKDINVFFYHELVTKDVNAIHVSVYAALAFFSFFIKPTKKVIDYIIITTLLLMVFLLSSKNIIVVFIGLMVVYHLFYSKKSKQLRMKNLIVFVIFLFSLTFVGKIKDRFRQEYETIMTDSTVNDVITKNEGIVYNVSIKQAWTNKTFKQNDYFPGTAFRVYQFRIFLEMLQKDHLFWKGFGLNASYPKIEAKGIEHNIYLGVGSEDGYQKKNFHNQYIQNFAELGVFGFLILIIMLFVNLKNALKNKDFIHISFAVLMISLFLTESFLWRQRGVVFFTIMFCLFNSGLGLFNIKKNKKHTNA
jgi:O-antigen ligase